MDISFTNEIAVNVLQIYQEHAVLAEVCDLESDFARLTHNSVCQLCESLKLTQSYFPHL